MNQSITCPDNQTARDILGMRDSASDWIDAAITRLAESEGAYAREVAARNLGADYLAEHPDYAVLQAAHRRHAMERTVNRPCTAAEAVRFERAFVDDWNRVRA